MLLFLASILLTVVFLFLLFNLLVKITQVEKSIVLFLSTCAYGVFLFELSGLLGLLNKPGLIIGLQVIMAAFALLMNRIFKIGIPNPSLRSIRDFFASSGHHIKKNPGLVVFGGFLTAIYLVLAFLQFRLPQNNIDGLLNHLSRIAHWMQQGSLSTYTGFNSIGTSYPYNNSLLMMWSMIFLRSDVLSGFVQYFAALFTALTIYAFAVELDFNQKASLFSGLLFLTFPIILFESGTSQNDLLVASFLVISFYFLIRHFHSTENLYLVLSILAFVLAAGTNQYAIFALPGYAIFFILLLWKNRKNFLSYFGKCLSLALFLFILFGSYTYIQNWIRFGSPMGGDYVSNMIFPEEKQVISGDKLATNSLRLTYQFASCEGVPPYWETICIAAKRKILTPLLVNQTINLETAKFLLEPETPFKLDEHYPLNEESSWYGQVGFILLSMGFITGLIWSIRKKKVEGYILLGTALFFFLCIASIKPGWDPYVGRYLIFSSTLIAPFSTGVLNSRKWYQKVFVILLCVFGIFTSVYCVINNDSKPLIGKRVFYRTSWNEMSEFQKKTFKYSETLRHDKGVWYDDELMVRTLGEKEYYPILEMVNNNVPVDGTLAILSTEGYYFPDYLFFGESFKRIIREYTTNETLIESGDQSDYLLISPFFSEKVFMGYLQVDEIDHWRLFQKAQSQ